MARLECVWLYDFIYRIRFDWLSYIIAAVLSLNSLVPSVCTLSHLVLRNFCPFLPSSFASAAMLIKIFQHNVFVANSTRLCSSTTRFDVLGELDERPNIFTKFASHRFSRTDSFMCLKQLWLNHLIAK